MGSTQTRNPEDLHQTCLPTMPRSIRSSWGCTALPPIGSAAVLTRGTLPVTALGAVGFSDNRIEPLCHHDHHEGAPDHVALGFPLTFPA